METKTTPPTELPPTSLPESQVVPQPEPQPQYTKLPVEVSVAPARTAAPIASPKVHTEPTALQSLRDQPAWIDCPFCYARAQTKIAKENTDSTCCAGALCCLCCGPLCMWIPFAFHWYADIEHFCGACNQRVAYIPHEGGSTPVKVQVFGPGDVGPVMQGVDSNGKTTAPEMRDLERGEKGGVVVDK